MSGRKCVVLSVRELLVYGMCMEQYKCMFKYVGIGMKSGRTLIGTI